MSLQFEVLSGPEAILKAFPQWGALLDKCAGDHEAPDFFLCQSWLEPWLEHFGSRGDVHLAVLKADGDWVAGLPMQVTKGNYGSGTTANRLSAAGFPESDVVFIPAISSDHRHAFIEQLISWWKADLPKVQAIDLREIPEQGPTEAAFQKWAEDHNDTVHLQTVSRSPRYLIQTFIDAGHKLTGKVGSNLRRRARILEEAGQVEFAFECLKPDQVEAMFEACAAIENESWKGKEDLGMMSDAKRPLMGKVWRLLAENNELVVATLSLDGRIIAYHWGILRGGIFLSYNLAHQPDVHKLSPGIVLLQRMIEAATELGITEMDASRGGLDHDHILAPYKGPVRMHGRVILFRKSVKGRLMNWNLARKSGE